MGGRGTYSYSSSSLNKKRASGTLSDFAVASLNRGTSGGTTPNDAIDRFRSQMMDERYEYSAYIDKQGYIHSLASTGNEGSTGVKPPSSLAHERDVYAVIHNHPSGGSDGRIWGGPFSGADLDYISTAHMLTGGRINTMIATAKEGTYKATVTKRVSSSSLSSAIGKAESSLSGKKFNSEKSYWKAVNDAYSKEMGKIGINIEFTPQKVKRSKFVTQKLN